MAAPFYDSRFQNVMPFNINEMIQAQMAGQQMAMAPQMRQYQAQLAQSQAISAQMKAEQDMIKRNLIRQYLSQGQVPQQEMPTGEQMPMGEQMPQQQMPEQQMLIGQQMPMQQGQAGLGMGAPSGGMTPVEASLLSEALGLPKPETKVIDGRNILTTPFGSFDLGRVSVSKREEKALEDLESKLSSAYERSEKIQELSSIVNDPFFKQALSSVPGQSARGLFNWISKNFGSKEKQELFSKFETLANELLIDSSGRFKGTLNNQELFFLKSVKPSLNDTYAQSVSKIETMRKYNDLMIRRNDRIIELVESGLSLREAQKLAQQEIKIQEESPAESGNENQDMTMAQAAGTNQSSGPSILGALGDALASPVQGLANIPFSIGDLAIGSALRAAGVKTPTQSFRFRNEKNRTTVGDVLEGGTNMSLQLLLASMIPGSAFTRAGNIVRGANLSSPFMNILKGGAGLVADIASGAGIGGALGYLTGNPETRTEEAVASGMLGGALGGVGSIVGSLSSQANLGKNAAAAIRQNQSIVGQEINESLKQLSKGDKFLNPVNIPKGLGNKFADELNAVRVFNKAPTAENAQAALSNLSSIQRQLGDAAKNSQSSIMKNSIDGLKSNIETQIRQAAVKSGNPAAADKFFNALSQYRENIVPLVKNKAYENFVANPNSKEAANKLARALIDDRQLVEKIGFTDPRILRAIQTRDILTLGGLLKPGSALDTSSKAAQILTS